MLVWDDDLFKIYFFFKKIKIISLLFKLLKPENKYNKLKYSNKQTGNDAR